MTPTVRIETGDHSGAGIFLAARFAATGSMGIKNVFLIFLRLLRRQPHLGKLPHAGVDAIHHFSTLDFALQQDLHLTRRATASGCIAIYSRFLAALTTSSAARKWPSSTSVTPCFRAMAEDFLTIRSLLLQ